MRGKFSAIVISAMICLSLVVFTQIPNARSQPYDAWFTHIYVTNGNDEIDLISGGTAKVYSGQRAFQKLVYYNNGIGDSNTARLYTKIYRNNQLVGTSTIEIEANLELNSSRTDQFSSSLKASGTYSCRVELWWRHWYLFAENNTLIDTKEFELKVVELNVTQWNPSPVSVNRGFGTGTLNVAFTNGGNDNMYDVIVSPVVTSGLTVTPQTQNLGLISEGESKSTPFSVQANRDITPMNYTLAFEIAYNDFIGVTHRETFMTQAAVTSNFIIDNLYSIILVSAIIVICVVAVIYFARSRRSKTEIPPPPP